MLSKFAIEHAVTWILGIVRFFGSTWNRTERTDTELVGSMFFEESIGTGFLRTELLQEPKNRSVRFGRTERPGLEGIALFAWLISHG